MSDFRKLLLAFAAVALLAGIASAQVAPPIVCSATAQPLTVRTEGLAEQTGDVVIACSGGAIPTVGSTLPQVNISVTLSTNITSRSFGTTASGDNITEALLFVDDPQPGTQNPCAPAQGQTVCSPLTAGAGGAALDSSGVNRNVYQGVQQGSSSNTIVFLAVPINAPGTQATRLFRIKNVRAAVAGASAQNGQIFAFVSIQNPPANLQLNQATTTVAFVQQGLTFNARSRTGGGYSATTTARTFLFQCDNVNRDLAASNTARYTGSPGTNGRSMEVRFRENYAASWKVRDINPPLQEPPAQQQNLPQLNNGAPQTGNGTVVESGFFNTGFTTINGLNRAGRADHGTRLRVVFNNVPANINVFVSAHSLAAGSLTEGNPNGGQAFGGGETSTSNTGILATAYGVVAGTNGANGIAANTVLVNPTSDAEIYNATNTLPAGFPAGAIGGLIQVPITGGTGSFTWEVFNQDPNNIDTVSFAVGFAYRPTNNPGLGQATINGSFAPVVSTNTISATAPIPRFADQSTATNLFSVNVCQTNLLFPFVTNQAGFDTGIAISNTSSDPFGTTAQSGNCEINYYGASTGGGAAPSKQTTTTAIGGGQVLAFSVLAGGTNGIAATPGFQGYIIAICNFRYAHGFAYISNVGGDRVAEGYLALIMDNSGAPDSTNRTGLTGENLGQ